MAGIFPASWDGGIPPNEETLDNPPQAYKPDVYHMPPDTTPLYFGLGCDTRIRAHMINSIISEIVAVCDHAGFAYVAGRLNNLANAVSVLSGHGPLPPRPPFGPLHLPTPPFGPLPISRPPQDISVRHMKAEIDALKREIAALKNVAPEHWNMKVPT